MYIVGCLYPVVPRWWRISGRGGNCWLIEGWADVSHVRAICYDESVYPEPYTYNPARFLTKDGKIDPSVKAPETRIFGSGRRYEHPCHAYQLLEPPLLQDLPWTPLSAPHAVSHRCTRSCYFRRPSSSRRQWKSKDPRGQLPQDPRSVSLQI